MIALVLFSAVYACDNSCAWSFNGACNYFGNGDDSWPQECPWGTDCYDCGDLDVSLVLPSDEDKCADTCILARNGVCDYVQFDDDLLCALGTDCSDCLPWALDNIDDDYYYDDPASDAVLLVDDGIFTFIFNWLFPADA